MEDLFQELYDAIEDVLNSEDDTGCDGNVTVTVVDKSAIENLKAKYEALKKTPEDEEEGENNGIASEAIDFLNQG